MVLSELEMVETEAEESHIRERIALLRDSLGKSAKEVDQFRKEFDKLAFHNVGQWNQSAYNLASCLKGMLDISREAKNLRAREDSPERLEPQTRGAAPVPLRSLRSNRSLSQHTSAVVDLSEKEEDAIADVFEKPVAMPSSRNSGGGMLRYIDSALSTPETRVAQTAAKGAQDLRSQNSSVAIGIQEIRLKGKRPSFFPEELTKQADENGHILTCSGDSGKRKRVSSAADHGRFTTPTEILNDSDVEPEDTGTETESNCGTIDLT